MGRVKTRLSRDIGYGGAVTFYRQSVHRLLTRLGGDPRWQTRLAVNDNSAAKFRCWPSSIHRMPQGSGSLGSRMNFVFDALPPGYAIIIGTDTPHIEPNIMAAAFEALNTHDAVFGPADDGGYWLIGLARRRLAPDLFSGVRWSTEHALEDTINSLPTSFTAAQLGVMTDVDTGEDKKVLQADMGNFRRGPWRAVGA